VKSQKINQPKFIFREDHSQTYSGKSLKLYSILLQHVRYILAAYTVTINVACFKKRVDLNI